MLYLNQAGTSWPKHPSVLAAINSALSLHPGHWEEAYHGAYEILCRFFNIPWRAAHGNSSGFLFTTSCTSAIYLALSHLDWQPGDKVITSSLEHYALSSCLESLASKEGVVVLQSHYRPGNPIDLNWVEQELKKGRVKCLAISHGSNVTGELLPINILSTLAHRHGALLLIDGAQTAGTLPIDLKEIGADIFVFAGHKGPGGPQGIGGLYIRPEVKLIVPAASCQVTKRACENALSFCNTGTVNLAGVLGLSAALECLKKKGIEAVRKNNIIKTKKLLAALSSMPLEIYGTLDADLKTTAVAFNLQKETPTKTSKELMEKLKKEQVHISHGLQCAPWAHAALNTSSQGVFRVSPGVMNTEKEVEIFANLLEEALV